MYIRMINPLYISPNEKVVRTCEHMEEIEGSSVDHRAAVNAAAWLFNAEASVIQSAYTAYAAEISELAEVDDEAIDSETGIDSKQDV